MGDRLAAHCRTEIEGRREGRPDTLPQVDVPRDRDSYLDEVIDNFIANVRKMKTFAGARDAAFLLVLPPELNSKRTRTTAEQAFLAQLNADCGYLLHGVSERFRQLAARTLAFCERHAIPAIDVNAEPSFAESPETLFLDGAHPNARGHEVIADIIAKALAAAGC
jgi:lysophospholipase L1-like esterase